MNKEANHIQLIEKIEATIISAIVEYCNEYLPNDHVLFYTKRTNTNTWTSCSFYYDVNKGALMFSITESSNSLSPVFLNPHYYKLNINTHITDIINNINIISETVNFKNNDSKYFIPLYTFKKLQKEITNNTRKQEHIKRELEEYKGLNLRLKAPIKTLLSEVTANTERIKMRVLNYLNSKLKNGEVIEMLIDVCYPNTIPHIENKLNEKETFVSPVIEFTKINNELKYRYLNCNGFGNKYTKHKSIDISSLFWLNLIVEAFKNMEYHDNKKKLLA